MLCVLVLYLMKSEFSLATFNWKRSGYSKPITSVRASTAIFPSTVCHWTVKLFVWSVWKCVSNVANFVWLGRTRQLCGEMWGCDTCVEFVQSAAMNQDPAVLLPRAVCQWLLCQPICVLASLLAPCLFVLDQYVYFNQRAFTPASLIESPSTTAYPHNL